jgi:dTDP-4-dehydrorhamnose 3,5-epimerase
MEISELSIKGSWVARLSVYTDERGNFREWFKREEVLEKTGFDFSTSQANVSVSNRGVVRGIHYSLAKEGQAKWISCINGAIIDVIVDIRPKSPTFGQVEYVELSADSGIAVLIEPGLGHGFISLENRTAVSYLLNSPFAPDFEHEINPTDPALNINWLSKLEGEVTLNMSLKDLSAPSLDQRKKQGQLPA